MLSADSALNRYCSQTRKRDKEGRGERREEERGDKRVEEDKRGRICEECIPCSLPTACHLNVGFGFFGGSRGVPSLRSSLVLSGQSISEIRINFCY